MIIFLGIVATVALMIVFNALYVAAEFATVAARKTRISQLAGEGNRTAQRLLPILENSHKLDQYVAACQLGITISSLVLGAYGQNVIAERLSLTVTWLTPAITGLIVIVCITILQVILGELLPKSIAVQFPEDVAMVVMTPMVASLFILRPLIWLFNGSGKLILRLLGRDAKEKKSLHSPEEIELLVSESHEGGLLDDSERQMLRNAFRMRELTARQVMLHRTKLVTAAANSTVVDLMNMAIEAGFSRIPLYGESIDDIIGFVHVKDLFRLHVQGQEHIEESTIRKAIYVPETLPIVDVWEKLNQGRKYLAIVFDEYGGTAGLITLEDLIEEVFGELQDEFDDEMALIARDKEGRVYLRGDLLVTDVNEYLELDLPIEGADTLSGLIFSMLGRAPEVNDKIDVSGTVIRVEAMADLGVSEVSILLAQKDEVVASFSEWEVEEHD